MTEESPWGSDGVISLPEPISDTTGEKADLGGFCFTAGGIRVDISSAEREDILIRGFGPEVDNRG